MMQVKFILILLFSFNGFYNKQDSQKQDSVAHTCNLDTINFIRITRNKTIFDKKDTNSAVGKCYLKINDLIALYKEVTPKTKVTKWYLPFNLKNRSDTTLIKIISPFGAGRTSHLRGHKHSGTDMVPAKPDTGIKVYPIAAGVVCFKKIKDPFSCITIKHKINDTTFIYSSYIHLKEIYVNNGDSVNFNTPIGKIFTHKEVLKYRGPYDHLHLEIRKNFDDFGFGSSHCMNKKELNEFFFDPIIFLKKNL